MLACYHNAIPINTISPLERGFLYGDGLFTSLKVVNGVPELWMHHLHRLRFGTQQLGLTLNWDALEQHLSLSIYPHYPNAIVKIIITRGEASNGRGYLPPIQTASFYTQVFSHNIIEQQPISAGILTQSLGQVTAVLSGIKTLNRLEQVILRQELAQTSWGEALVCDASNNVVEGVFSNCFMRINKRWLTPEIKTAGITGVMRAHILQSMHHQKIPVIIGDIKREQLTEIEALFFCNALMGITPVSMFFETLTQHIKLDTQIVMALKARLALS